MAEPTLKEMAETFVLAYDHEQVLAENERLRRDADRYRWLRGGSDVPASSVRWPRWEVRHWDGHWWQTLFAEHMDAAIDAAMACEPPNA